MKKIMFKIVLTGVCIFIFTINAQAAEYYISPSGNDSNVGTELAPWLTFDHSFNSIAPGDTLILLDGNYSIANNTGCINFNGANSSQIPSGVDRSHPTIVKAKNLNNVTVDGTGDYEENALFIGRSTRKDSFIKIEGIIFEGGGQLYNTSYVYLKNCGFHGTLSIGTADHAMGNTYNLIEDCWVWAENRRGVVDNYGANYNIWRRVVIRGDGCSLPECAGSGNPNIGFTVYDSQHVSVQNVIIVDRILNGGSPYSDFATAQHSGGTNILLGENEWLGCVSIASEDTAYYFEADSTIDPTWHLDNSVAISDRTNVDSFNIGNGTNSVMENLTAINLVANNQSFFRYGGSATGSVSRNLIGFGNNAFGLIRGGTSSYINLSGSFSNNRLYETSIVTGDSTVDPGLLYPLRLEVGSSLYGAGYNGNNYGATVLYKYGVDGTFYGESGYNNITANNLWPWPNEDIIKSDMAVDSQRGFCSAGKQLNNTDDITLTSYIWEFLGNQIPNDIYGVVSEIRADVDQNSSINTTDAMLTLRNSLSLDMTSTNWQAGATTGDANCDGSSNSTDAMLILRKSLGLDMTGTGWCVS